ncbi:hypothetical protein MtrunA17_Chr6g0488141 [Medicago truncatula]|uniref:Uncharacterized protein n=1 Tax=Medicago truncatula TaxID=3880 RepID=A0A396HKZ2_MEDTR|nr:hypothetical protein MtrunA17_Chr6g0488141 [Medicago truncatula]
METTGLIPHVGENYTLKLKNTMQEILSELPKESPEFSHSSDALHELMQTKVDPPFDVIWVYSAIKFGCRKSLKGDILEQISAAKALFQLISACSASVGGSKSIALLAPVVFMIHSVVKELFELKREKKAMKEVKSLIWIWFCLSRLWVVDNDDDDETNEGFETLLPLVSSDVCGWICGREFHVGYLAGAVMMEVFLLKLCLFFDMGMEKSELEMCLKSWSVGSISSFQNVYFLEVLMRTTLETSLPLSSILKAKDEFLLKKVLFDALLLVEYSFIYENAKNIKSLALTRLIITHVAVEYLRELDQNRVVSYSKAFSSSNLPSQIIKLVSNQNGIEENAGKTNGSSPRALINWLLRLENLGIKVFAGEEDNQSKLISDAFVAAAQTMKSSDKESRKRKGKSSGKKVKFVKYDLAVNSVPVKGGTSASNDSSSDESEVEDPNSDSDA